MTADEILVKVNEFLDNLRYDRKPNGLYDPIKYVLSMGGKRIRPTLMLLAYNLYKDDPESILMPACALETYHNYTLLHDDLMDNADVRRGKTTVHRKWNANTAILSGDSMLVLAYERMSNCGAKYLKDVLDVFTETALEIGEGQQYDMDFETRNDVTEDEYIEMIRLKTAVLYSFFSISMRNSVCGVFPVPPTAKLPTPMIGIENDLVRKIFASKRKFRIWVIAP